MYVCLSCIRELAKRLSTRHEAKASKERKKLTKSRVPAAIYLDGKFSTSSEATSSPQEYQYLNIEKKSEERCLGGGEEIIIEEEGTDIEKSDVFPSTSQSRCLFVAHTHTNIHTHTQ